MTTDSFLSLLAEAREAGKDVDEVSDGHGRSIRIERDPDLPDATKLTFVGMEEETVREQWQIRATAVRPGLYPESLPFVANIPCTIMAGDKGVMMHWRQLACPTPAVAESFVESLPPKAQEVMKSIRESVGDDASDADRARELKRLREEVSEEDLSRWLSDASAGAEPEAGFVEAYEQLCSSNLEGGWSESTDHTPLPHEKRSTRFHRSDMERRISLSCIMGITQMSMFEGLEGEVRGP